MRRDFKGIWIPKEIWLMTGLKPAYRIFLSEIDSLDNGDGCYASNGHFSELFGLSKSRCSEIITMLSEQGYVTISYEDNGRGEERRVIRLNAIVEKSNPPSENRQAPSENRQTPSENRIPIYDEKYNEKYNEGETRAIDFLKTTNLSQWETFCMQYKTQIDDFVKFTQDFNDVYDDEERDYEVGKIVRRMGRYARNWIALSRKQKNKTVTAYSGPKLARLN